MLTRPYAQRDAPGRKLRGIVVSGERKTNAAVSPPLEMRTEPLEFHKHLMRKHSPTDKAGQWPRCIQESSRLLQLGLRGTCTALSA
jgi:hypothetical protein